MITSKDPQEKINNINIEQDNKKYLLTIKIKGGQLTLVLSDPEIENLFFTKKMTLKEIKELDNYFNGLESCDDFFNYLKDLVDEKKLNIIKKEENLSLNFTVKYFSKKNSIELILSPEAKDNDELIKGLCKEVNTLKEKIKILENKESIINELKSENENLKKEIKNLKEEIKEIKVLIEPIKRYKEIKINRYTTFNEKSVIMKEDEFNFIKPVIEVKINKKIKEIKKLYQATVDGDLAKSFHKKCDGFANTLVIIKSGGNRRFGGFTTIQWWSPDNKESYSPDKYAFLFSLDNKKIYPFIGQEHYYSYSNQKHAVYLNKDYGPSFGGCQIYKNNDYSFDYNLDISICSNCIRENKSSFTYESNTNSSYDFCGDKNALSEDGKKGGIYITEYEVFQVMFE